MSQQKLVDEEQNIDFKSLFTPLTTKKVAIFIFIIGFIVFVNTLGNHFVWDDLVLFYSGETYRSIANIGYIFLDHSMPYYRPIPFALLATFYTLFGDTVFWYHLFQITLHCANTILLYLLFKKFIPNPISFILALIFLVHPIQVESVSYIASIINPLLLFFGLSAMFLAQTRRIKGFLKYGLISLLLLLAVLTKELGFLFLLFIPLYIVITRQKKVKKKEWYSLGFSYIAALLPFIYLRFFITNIVAVHSNYTPVPIMNASLYERLISMPKIIFYYITTLFYPKDLAISQHWLVNKISIQDFYLPLVVVVCFFSIFILGIFFLRHNRMKLTIYLFFLLWLFLSWGMHWNIIHPLDMTVADRWFYLPFVGLLGAVGILISELKVNNELAKRIGIIFVVIIISLLSFRTIARNADWQNPLTLYLKDAKISTESYDLETQLGEQLTNNGRYAEAKPHLNKAIELAPQFWANWTVLGIYYVKTKQIDNAIHAYSTSIKNNSGTNLAYVFLADTYFNYKTLQETKAYLADVLKKFPTDPYFIYLDGVVDYKLGNKHKGMENVLRAYSLSKNQKFLVVYQAMQRGQSL